jgi:hypothetical protein
MSPAVRLGAEATPISRSAAGATGIGATAPPEQPAAERRSGGCRCRQPEWEVGRRERGAVHAQRVAGPVRTRHDDALGHGRRRCARGCGSEAEGRVIEGDREGRLQVDVDRRGGGRRRRSGGSLRARRSRGRAVLWARHVAREVGVVVVGVRAAACVADCGRRCTRGGRGRRALVVGGGAVADEIAHRGDRRAAARRRAARERGRVVDERHLATGGGEVRRARGVRGGQRGSRGASGGELHEVVAARAERAGEGRHLPGRPGCGRVLDRPAGQVDGRRAPVEELDVVVREGRAGVAAPAVDLADDEVG